MSIFTIIYVTFAMMGFSVIGMALWAVWYPKTLCQSIRPNDVRYSVCVKSKHHDGAHMTAEGKDFRIKDDSCI